MTTRDRICRDRSYFEISSKSMAMKFLHGAGTLPPVVNSSALITRTNPALLVIAERFGLTVWWLAESLGDWSAASAR